MWQTPVSHNLFNRYRHFAYSNAAMWLKCVQHLKMIIFTQTFCNECNLVCKKINPAFSPSGYMEGGIWWVFMHAKNNRFLALYQPCRSVQFKMVSVWSEKPISTLSCLRSFPNITLETVPMCIILWQRPMEPFNNPSPSKSTVTNSTIPLSPLCSFSCCHWAFSCGCLCLLTVLLVCDDDHWNLLTTPLHFLQSPLPSLHHCQTHFWQQQVLNHHSLLQGVQSWFQLCQLNHLESQTRKWAR